MDGVRIKERGKSMRLGKKKALSPFKKKMERMKKNISNWNKTYKHWKTKFYLTVVFPAVLVALIVQAVKSYVRIKLMEIGMKTPSPFKES